MITIEVVVKINGKTRKSLKARLNKKIYESLRRVGCYFEWTWEPGKDRFALTRCPSLVPGIVDKPRRRVVVYRSSNEQAAERVNAALLLIGAKLHPSAFDAAKLARSRSKTIDQQE